MIANASSDGSSFVVMTLPFLVEYPFSGKLWILDFDTSKDKGCFESFACHGARA